MNRKARCGEGLWGLRPDAFQPRGTTSCAHRVLTPLMLIHFTSYQLQVCEGLSERQGRTSLQQRAIASEQHERPRTKILIYLNNKKELMLALPSYEIVAEIFHENYSPPPSSFHFVFISYFLPYSRNLQPPSQAQGKSPPLMKYKMTAI